jgi:hypothetical protein
VVGGIQDNVLNRFLGNRTLNKLLDAEAALGSNAYQVTELLNDLKKGIWSELAARKPVDIYRRNLQKSYVNSLSNLVASTTSISIAGVTVTSTSPDKSDVKSVVRAHLASLRTEVVAAAAAIPDQMTKFHLQDVSKRIDNILNPRN